MGRSSTILKILSGSLRRLIGSGKHSFGRLNGSKFIISPQKYSWFQYLITLTIVVNSFCLALYDYSDRDSNSPYNRVLETINYACTVIYLMEVCLKIGAMGFILDENSYLRSGWNIMDFIISVLG
jgi:hypothetical protein